MSELAAQYEITIIPKSGESFVISGKSDSYVKNFACLLCASFLNENVSCVNVNGESIDTKGFSSGYSLTVSGYPTRTIGIGSGFGVVTADDYCLDSQYSEDVVEYYPQIELGDKTPIYDSGESLISVLLCRRLFRNKSDSDLSMRELGLFFRSGSNDFLVLRDVLESAIIIPAGGTCVVVYTMQGEI
jgi:hypothetical protein